MYYFHPTPDYIVDNIVKKHAPRNYNSLLDPSIGDGALINGLKTNNKEITCVDIDIARLNQSNKLLNHKNLNLLHGDFLDLEFDNKKYDFIVCNPPFDGRNQVLFENKKIPIEAEFLKKCMELCSDNGRMIFILPSSVTRGTRLKWFRFFVLNEFNLSYSYKLPKFTFNKVEGDFSVLVFDKTIKRRKTILRSENKEIITTNIKGLSKACSFDADELIALKNYKKLLCSSGFKFEPFDQVINLKRGCIKSNYKQDNVLHTTNCNHQFKIKDSSVHSETEKVEDGDWIVKRVSRNLSESLKEYKGCSIQFTDCILRLRAKDINKTYEVFFVLSVLFQLEDFKEIIIKGSGAKYLDVITLKKIGLPLELAYAYSKHFKLFKDAPDSKRYDIVKQVAFMLKNKKHSEFNEKPLSKNIIVSDKIAV